ncbi:hypothetical protein ACOKXV_12350 [Sporosarcina psychrophila]|uniref:hypothetical protein n=1 Tax=Sporosarcina psychrophila TaxID=1476 RepID=UPI003BA263D4
MKSKRVSVIVISALFILGGCSSSADQVVETPDITETDTPEKQIESPETNPEQTHEEILAQVTSAIETDVKLMLPEDIFVGEGYLTATTASSKYNYEVNFYVTNVPIPVNDSTLHDAHPYMIVNGTRYDSAASAKAKINYQPINDSAQKVDLGNGITGYEDAGAGSIFLTWHEGRWSFSMRNRNSEAGSAKMNDLAKEIVAKLEDQLLPAPQKIGAAMFDMNSEGAAANSFMWQEEEVVYEVYTVDPLLLVDTVTDQMK